jgi:hypothetical protein
VYAIRTHVSNIFNKAEYLHFSGNYISLLSLFLATVWLNLSLLAGQAVSTGKLSLTFRRIIILGFSDFEDQRPIIA